MNLALAGVALAVLAGAVVAVTARDGRGSVTGLAATLILAPLVAAPIGSRLSRAPETGYHLWHAAG